MKESYVKAIGVGITINLQTIRFKINTKSLKEDEVVDNTELFVNGEKVNWKFHEVLVDPEHCVSVALDKQSAPKICFKMMNFIELMQDCVPVSEIDESFVKQYFTKPHK